MITHLKAHNIGSFIELASQQGANENTRRRAISQIIKEIKRDILKLLLHEGVEKTPK